jgi:hypothetical protein
MNEWLIYVQGVNLGDTVFCVNDLSALRGASLVLEAFGYELKEELSTASEATQAKITPIVHASSIAAFKVECGDLATAEKLHAIAIERLARRARQDAVNPLVLKGLNQTGPAQQHVYAELNLEMPSEHMTFASALVEIGATTGADSIAPLREAMNRAVLIVRRKQMTLPNLPISPSIQLSNPSANGLIAAQCEIDNNQQVGSAGDPGNTIWMHKDQYKNAPVVEEGKTLDRKLFSTRSAHLRKYGRYARQDVYKWLIPEGQLRGLTDKGLFGDFAFAEDFTDISKPEDDWARKLPASLGGKLAVLYLDGIGFTKRANDDPQGFSSAVRLMFADMMSAVVGRFLDGSGAKVEGDVDMSSLFAAKRLLSQRSGVPKGRPLRFETLIVGGDDACLIMPPWLAFEITELAMKTLAASAAEHADAKGAGFRAGLAIAPVGTPFRRIRGLAYQLMKDARDACHPKDQVPAISVQIIEGQDLRDRDDSLKSLRAAYRGNPNRNGEDETDHVQKVGAALRWKMSDHETVMQGMRNLKTGFARTSLFRIIQEVDNRGKDVEEELVFAAAIKRYADVSGGDIRIEDLEKKLPGNDKLPLSLRLKVAAELWDYVDPLAEFQK